MALRLGFRMVKNLSSVHAKDIVGARGDQPYSNVVELRHRTRVPRAALERLAEADAFQSLGLDRRAALWVIRGLRDEVLPLFAALDEGCALQPEMTEPSVALATMSDGGNVVEDYASIGLTLRQHPIALLREELHTRGIIPCAKLGATRDGQRVTVAGLVLVRQRPGSATGVTFITLEDETGIGNLIIWASLFEKQRQIVMSASMIACQGRLQREGDVIHVIAECLEDFSNLLRRIGSNEPAFTMSSRWDSGAPCSTGCVMDNPGAGRNSQKDIHPPIRDFH